MARTTYAAIRYRTKGQPGGRDLFRKLCCLADEYRAPSHLRPADNDAVSQLERAGIRLVGGGR